MDINRRYSKENVSSFDLFSYKTIDVVMYDNNGNVMETYSNLEFPESWSDNACKVCASKYFRKKGVGSEDGSETSIKQVVNRLANCWAEWGFRHKYFDRKNSIIFYDEMVYLLLSQTIAPNSPQWFNTGLFESYGIKGKDAGYWYYDRFNKSTTQSTDTYSRVPANACYILDVKDSLLGDGGILDSIKTEAKIFKFGSGSGANFSKLRGSKESLESGGTSSGLMSFLKVFDSNAGAIKSGGYTRRSAKMVIVDDDHPEVMDFIEWKSKEEDKAQALIAAGYNSHFEGEAYQTVSGQQSNNSIAITNDFMNKVNGCVYGETYNKCCDGECNQKNTHKLMNRTNNRTTDVCAKEMFNKICESTWKCGDPGMIFIDTVNEMNTLKNTAPIRATNPCAEFIHIDNTACNLASINLIKFFNPDTDSFDFESFEYVIELLTIMLDITVTMSHYPTESIAYNTYNSRPLGIGFANLGAMLMQRLDAYWDDKSCCIAMDIAAVMTMVAYRTSAQLGKELGCPKFCKENRDVLYNVINKHKENYDAANSRIHDGRIDSEDKFFEDIHYPSSEIIERNFNMLKYFYENEGDSFVRNSQVTAIAPTGTIAIIMDCDTTGIEPAFSLVSYKSLSGGGTMKFVNKSVEIALNKVLKNKKKVEKALKHIEAHNSVSEIDDLGEYYGVFATAVGESKVDTISPHCHIDMCSWVQGVVSGGISKTINCPNSTTVSDIADLYMYAFNSKLKAVSIYRDGCKSSQPLSIKEHEHECSTCGTGQICDIQL